MRPEIDDEWADRLEQHTQRILDGPVEASELSFQRQLEIVFEAAHERTSGSTDTDDGSDDEESVELDYQDEHHPGGDAAAEAMVNDDL